MGLNINKAKQKLNSAKKTAQKEEDTLEHVNARHSHQMDYINSAVTVINSITDLTNKIYASKQETKQSQIAADLRQNELQHDLDKLIIELDYKRDELTTEVEKIRIEKQQEARQLDHVFQTEREKEITKRLKNEQEHKERMMVLATQKQILDLIANAYEKHAHLYFSGDLSAGFVEVSKQMQACISTINTALRTPANTHYIDIPSER